MNIIIYGLRGTGKSTVGKALAKQLNKQFIDLDKARLKKYKKTTEEVVKEGGWPLFRRQEKETTLEIANQYDDVIISAGGGTMMDSENAAALKKNGKAVLLTADISTMIKRIYHSSDKSNRPSLTDDKTPEKEVEEVWNQRKDTYLDLADLVVEASHYNLQQKIDKIINHFDLK